MKFITKTEIMKYLCPFIFLSFVSIKSFSQLINHEEWRIAANKVREISIFKIRVQLASNDTTLECVLVYDTLGKLTEKKESFNADQSKYISSRYKYYFNGRVSVTEKEVENPFFLRSDSETFRSERRCETYENDLLVKRESQNGSARKVQDFIYNENKLLTRSTVYIGELAKEIYTLSYSFY